MMVDEKLLRIFECGAAVLELGPIKGEGQGDFTLGFN
jgi:hypothetical protein